ncbi:arginine repressor [Gottschalkiaceae bacterium SANA]|jgi:transcriptional regulator of arginine metabolism|nr:arginine repressor [Gottschalkiaceae bacterium SANA]
MRKYARQSHILKLIKLHEIETQEELSALLKRDGFSITQATVSRDLKELGLIKALTRNGRYKYATMEANFDALRERLTNIFKNSVLAINSSGRMIIIKTISGAASITASAIDVLDLQEIIGTIAGDDTVFIAISDQADMEGIKDEFHKIIEK